MWGLMYGLMAWAVLNVSEVFVSANTPNLPGYQQTIVAALIPIAILYYLVRREDKGGGQGH